MTTTPACRPPQFITDGGIETHIIFNMGVELPHFSAFPLNDSTAGREVIRRYYRDYLPVARAAGRSFLFATDSWRASPDWADRLGYDRGLLKQNNVTSAALCAELADEFAAAGVESAIAGIIGPRRDAWQYDASMTVAEAHDYHSPQVEAFAGTAATSLHAYTLNIGIARAAERAGLPLVLSFTVETDGALPGGKPLGVAIAEVDEATGGYPAYYMINCAHPRHFARELRSGAPWVGRIGGLRANASAKSHAELDASPEIDIGDIAELADDHAELLPSFGSAVTERRSKGAARPSPSPRRAALNTASLVW
jgi:homocysteine S-methyltransferase